MSQRYPLSSLVSAFGRTEADLARAVGMDSTTLRRARQHGLTEQAADRFAVRAGFAPWLVWSNWLEDAERVCADESCLAPFVPARRNQKYHDPRCARRVATRNYQRRKYAADATYREAKLAASRAYRDEARRARLAYQRRYYNENRELLLAKKAAYREANRELIRERQREYRRRAA